MNYIKEHWRLTVSIWIAFVFIQSLFFKFSGSYETQHIFGTLADWSGLQWFGHIGGYTIGTLELIASILLFTRFWGWGAMLAFGIITSAVLFHLFTPLGIVMPEFDANGNIIGDDGGLLFVMACITMTGSGAILLRDWNTPDGALRTVLGIVARK